jgi:hypothetical protein
MMSGMMAPCAALPCCAPCAGMAGGCSGGAGGLCGGSSGIRSTGKEPSGCDFCPCGIFDCMNPLGLPAKLRSWQNELRDVYISGKYPELFVAASDRQDAPWNAKNICFCHQMTPCGGQIPCKVHVKQCCCECCSCPCCDCCDCGGGCGFSTVGCQCPCTCIPELYRCCHCTCGKFPTFCHPVVSTLCCGDWEEILPDTANVPHRHGDYESRLGKYEDQIGHFGEGEEGKKYWPKGEGKALDTLRQDILKTGATPYPAGPIMQWDCCDCGCDCNPCGMCCPSGDKEKSNIPALHSSMIGYPEAPLTETKLL